jgi:PAS domain S-box-containing protein
MRCRVLTHGRLGNGPRVQFVYGVPGAVRVRASHDAMPRRTTGTGHRLVALSVSLRHEEPRDRMDETAMPDRPERPSTATPSETTPGDRYDAGVPSLDDRAPQDSEQRYRAIVEHLGELVCRFRTDGTILFANEPYARSVGATSAALEGRNFWHFIPPDEQAAVQALLATLTPRHPEVRIENRFSTVSGERWMLWINRGLTFDAAGRVIEAQSTGIDLTDIRHSMDVLRESEARLRALIQATSDVVYRMSPDWSEMQPLDGRGLVASSARAIRDWMARNLPATEHARVRAAIAAAIEGRTTFEMEHRVIRPDGSIGWTSSRAVPILDADGRITEWFGVASDITPRKSAEEALRRSEARYRALFESIDEAFCLLEIVFDASGAPCDHRFLEVNPAFERQTGLSDVVGRTARELMPDHDPAWFRRYAHILETGEPQRFEFPEPAIDRWFDAFAWRTTDGGHQRVAVLFKDITERVRIERALRESEERFRILADSMPQIVYVASRDGRTIYANAQWRAYTGFEHADEQAQQAVVHPDDLAEMLATWHSHSVSGETFTREFRLRRASDGAYRWFLTRLRPVRDQSGEISRWYGTSTDIHDMKVASEALTRAKEQAEAANVAKDNFLATLSHELRTPLTPALAALSLWEGHPSVQPPMLRDDLAMVARNLALEARLIDDLLDLTGIARGKLALALEAVDVNELVTAVVAMYRGEALARGVDLVLRAGDRPCLVPADPGRLQQVLWNLLKNAVKFTPPGGRVEVTERRVGGSHVEIAVADTGAGMSADTLARIFRPFEQGSADSVRRYGGLGLGLAISRALVEAHGGTIAASSDGPGQGSRLIVRLPCAPLVTVPDQPPVDAASGRRDAPAPYGVDARTLRVLVVEDHEDTAEMMQRLLSSRGHDVTVAGSVAAAISALQTSPFDVLVSDVGLPDGSGMDVVRHARQQLRLGVPAIAITGYGMDEDIARARNAGFDVHLTKPVNLLQLDEAVSRATRAR